MILPSFDSVENIMGKEVLFFPQRFPRVEKKSGLRGTELTYRSDLPKSCQSCL